MTDAVRYRELGKAAKGRQLIEFAQAANRKGNNR